MNKDILIIVALTVGLSAGLNINEKNNGEIGAFKKNNMYNINNIKNNNINNINNINNNIKININNKKQKLKRYNLIISRNYKYASRERISVLKTASTVAYKIKMVESHGRYRAKSKWSDACGAYQYISTTWNNFMGYANACKAPEYVQDKRMIKDLEWKYAKYGDWQKVIASHYYPRYANDKKLWNKKPTQNQPTVRQYVNSVMNIAI